MKEFPSVSVIIPTYNRAKFLQEAIDSVLHQTFGDFELIVVDDGSTDSTPEIAGTVLDSRFSYLIKNRGGVSSARNFGVSKSRAPLIAFLDSDDLWLPGKLQVQVDCFYSNPETAICQTEEIWIRNGRRVNPMNKHKKHSGWIFKECLPLCIVSPSAVMIRRAVFDELGGFDDDLPACEDYDLWLRAALRYPIITLDDALIMKRGGHPDQLSRQWGLDIYRIEALKKVLSDSHLTDEYRDLVNDEIASRAKIIALGAKRRGNLGMYEKYKSLNLSDY